MLVCKEVARLISDSYQRPLRMGERVALRVHLMMCKACTHFKEQVRLLHEAARRIAKFNQDEASEPRLTDSARQKIAAAMADKPPDGRRA